jgi:hypothetical protein
MKTQHHPIRHAIGQFFFYLVSPVAFWWLIIFLLRHL